MKVGLAGYSGSGVTTILSLLSEDLTLSEKQTGPEIRSLKLDDKRLDSLVDVCRPKKHTTVQLELIELGDLRPEEGGGIRSQTVSRAAGLDAMVLVLRGFWGPMAPQCRSADEILKELSSLSDEFCLTDLLPVENRMERLAKEGKLSSGEAVLLEKIKVQLEEGDPIRNMELTAEDRKDISGYQFLTMFPLMVIANIGEEGAGELTYPELERKCSGSGASYMEICGLSEMEVLEIPIEEREPFLRDLGLDMQSKERFISSVFRMLDLVTFYTVSDKEVRGWVVPEGTTAVKAAGKIHTDMERGFIRAEALSWDELCSIGGLAEARRSGGLRVEGKDYVIRDGDVIQIRFNI